MYCIGWLEQTGRHKLFSISFLKINFAQILKIQTSKLIGRSSVRIFVFCKRGSKISKINNCFATQAARMLEKNLLANGNKHYTQVQKNE